MRTPTDTQLALVKSLADGLADYFEEPIGNIACHLQAVKILIKDGPLQGMGFEQTDFLTFRKYEASR